MVFLARLAAFSVYALSFLSATVAAQASNRSSACGSVISSYAPTLNAVDVYACLISTPFRADVAKDLLQYWRTTMEFQSTLAYLKDPTRAYQQPPIDILRSLDLIRTNIDTGVYTNQYSFEASVQNVFFAAHDTHVELAGSIMGIFYFGAPFELVSVSMDGIALPKIYMADDVILMAADSSSTPSALATVNDQVAEDFLAVYASANSMGYLEPHGDWNGIMFSPAQEPFSYTDYLNGTLFYPGDDITVAFENGTSIAMKWQATNIQAVGLNITTGEQLYNYFVLGNGDGIGYLDYTDGGSTDANASSAIPSLSYLGSDWNSPVTAIPTTTYSGASPASTDVTSDQDGGYTGWGGAYPNVADIIQPNLGNDGYVTGYFLDESKVGVLSIPTFQFLGDSVQPFSDTVGEFLTRAKAAGMTKIVVDLQQNFGGIPLLATDTFKHFFPQINPFGGMRTRSFGLADELGTTFTNIQQQPDFYSAYNESYVAAFIQDPWGAALGVLDADNNQNFTSWAEYFGPHPDHGDYFSTVFRNNISNSLEDEESAGIVIYGYGNRSATSPQPYDAADIVLLTDGACASACDLFVEMMHHEAGVRSIVVGGLPQYGPMQARGGTRGAERYDSYQLDLDFEVGGIINTTLPSISPNRSSDATDQSSLGFNIADQIRPGEYTPLQFTYEAADCRIFWTPQTIFNMTNLWLYAASAAFFNASTCVKHSAEHNNTLVTDVWGPSDEQKAAWAASNPEFVPSYNQSGDSTTELAQMQFTGFEHEDFNGDGASYDHACTVASVAQDCGNINQFQCVNVAQCHSGILRQPFFTEGLKCRKRCTGRIGECSFGFMCTTEPVFQIGHVGEVRRSPLFCVPRKSTSDRVCVAHYTVLSAAPPIRTAMTGEFVDVEI